MTIKEIYDNAVSALNLTITEEQIEPIFNLINRKFFSNVQPVNGMPTDGEYEAYELSVSYRDAYQTVCELILERFESYNMQTLKGLGVNDVDTKLDITYQDVDEYLFKKFGYQRVRLI